MDSWPQSNADISINTLKVYDRRAKAFKQHAGDSFL
jgi:hypothetical protein